MAKAGQRLRCVALLRGINVGGKNRLAMKDLVAICEGAGCREVSTYIQSGNAVFTASAALAARLPAALEAAIEERAGLRVPVLLRSANELARVARENPFVAAGVDPGELHVVFLRDAAAGAAHLDPARSACDAFEVRGREVYLRCPDGLGRSKLTNVWFDAKLKTTSTVRNWRTVLKLAELSAAP